MLSGACVCTFLNLYVNETCECNAISIRVITSSYCIPIEENSKHYHKSTTLIHKVRANMLNQCLAVGVSPVSLPMNSLAISPKPTMKTVCQIPKPTLGVTPR